MSQGHMLADVVAIIGALRWGLLAEVLVGKGRSGVGFAAFLTLLSHLQALRTSFLGRWIDEVTVLCSVHPNPCCDQS